MNLQAIIDALAGQADELLHGVNSRKEAKTVLSETLASRYPKLGSTDRQKVCDGVLAILDEEGFFDSGRSGDSWSEGGDDASDDE